MDPFDAPDEAALPALRTVCEFNMECRNPVASWTSFEGFFYPVCAEHLPEAVRL